MKVFDIGLIDFLEGLTFQEEVLQSVRSGRFHSALILCSHHPVITMGRAAARANVLASESQLSLQGIKVVQTGRGGDVTYHGPGQALVYPIWNLAFFKKDIHAYLRTLERFLIGLLGEFGISGTQRKGLTGVWVDDKKIASIGIAVKHWITFHGLALNIGAADLKNFSLVKPCGMDIAMTSVESVLGREVPRHAIQEALIRRFTHDQSYFA
jgi:lipoate-protein ligase B